ncbi:MAG TPA: tetratricopeptide repeat protein [Gemmatimonadales bacterium]|jgi:tetratricopeptide (TPR) repeat protein|nr:tetratricopeptide repeat protein [Gemmatimonadales bacterium]
MSRSNAITVFALFLMTLAVGCRGADRPKTTSESVGATTPTVSASTSTESTGTGSVATPVTYESAEGVFNDGRYSEATRLFTAYTGSNPENPWGYYMLGLSAWRSGERERATEAFEHALQLDPSHRKSLFNSSRVLLEMDQPKKALERIEKALALEPMSNEGLRLLGRAKYQLGDVDGAIEAYHRALSLDEHDVWAMNNLGLIYIEQGRSDEALPPLARAVELRSNSPVFRNNLGTALERTGYPVAAAKEYEAALAVDSSYAKASVSLARVTGAGQQPESEPVDLGVFSTRFQADIEAWRASAAPSDSSTAPDSTTTPDSTAVPDSSVGGLVGLSDSSVASVEAVTDTLEECAGEN